jgi:hypothetical protein
MVLDKRINYIISGLERTGTSMLMQVLKAGDIPIGYDDSRKADNNNPKGYYELEGGKIINKLIDKTFQFDLYKGVFIKITAYGLRYLPKGRYKIIYSERNIEEILDSMEKMMDKIDEKRNETRKSLLRLNKISKQTTQNRDDIDVLFLNYNSIIEDSKNEIKKILRFLEIPDDRLIDMINAVNNRLYRQKRSEINLN